MSTDARAPRRPARRHPAATTLATKALALAAVGVGALVLAGCRQDMHDQPKLEAYEASTFFPDGMASRQPPAGTVARGQLHDDPIFFTGKSGDNVFVAELPVPADRALLVRGRERYDAFCSPCHGRLGDGQGMVARRGFKQPPSLHIDRIREQPVGYYFDVMTRGFGVMPSYAPAVPAEDRWAIAAYLRVLQQSQRTHLAELPEQDRAAVAALPPMAPVAAAPPVDPTQPGQPPSPADAPQPGHAAPDAPMGDPAAGDPVGGEGAAAAPTSEPHTP